MLALTACHPPATAIALSIEAEPGGVYDEVVVSIQSVELGLNAAHTYSSVALPSRLLVPVVDRAGLVHIDVDTLQSGRRHRVGGDVTTKVHQTVTLSLSVSVPPSCSDGRPDGDEAGLDCGGSCPPCDVGVACRGPNDCQTAACAAQGVCTLASGPPSWVEVGSLVPARANAAAASTPSGVVALGGVGESGGAYSLVERFNGSTWEMGPTLPAPHASLAAAWFDGGLWALSADGGVDTLPAGASAWASGPPLPPGVLVVAGAAVGPELVAVGEGATLSFGASGTWQARTPMTVPRTGFAVASFDASGLYAVGGALSGGQPSRAVELFLASQNSWAHVADLPTPRSDLAAVAAPDGRLWAIGGRSNGAPLDTVEALNVASGVWVTLPFLHVQRGGLAAALAPDGRLVVFGGFSNGQNQPTFAEVYGPVVRLSANRGAAGTMVAISGTNFAANARVTASLSPEGWVLGVGTTDAAGALASLSVSMPAVPPGPYVVTVVDERSRYPIRLSFEVTP